MNRKRKTDQREANSGGEHSTAKHRRKENSVMPFTILFADIAPRGQWSTFQRLQRDLVFDPRPMVHLSEVQKYAAEFEANVAVYPSEIGGDGVQWEFALKHCTRTKVTEKD